MRIIENTAAGGGEASYDAVSFQMVTDALSTTSIDGGWALCDRRERFNELAFNLYGVTVAGKTSVAAFDNATDSAALIAATGFTDDIASSTYLYDIAVASSEMSNFGYTFAGALDTGSAAGSFDTTSQSASMEAVSFSSDGTKMFTVGGSSTVYQYTLSTPWNVATASYDSVSYALAANAAYGIAWKTDGTRFYVMHQNADRVYQYDCATPWDISTASYNSVNQSVTSEVGRGEDLHVTLDGTKLYIVNNDGVTEEVEQYSMTTPWDLSTLTYDNKTFTYTTTTDPGGLHISADGTKMYISEDLSGNQIFQYTLSTPFDVSTATYDGVSYSGDVDSNSLAWKPDGTRFYYMNNTTDVVHQVDVTATASHVFLEL